MRTYFPQVVDNTMIKSMACWERFRLAHLLHLRGSEESTHLVAGGAFAAGLETYRHARFFDKINREHALQSALRTAILSYGEHEPNGPNLEKKSCEAVCGALAYYADQFPTETEMYVPFESNGKRTIEFSFAIPLPVLHPDTGEPLIYAGRCDQIVRHRETGIIYIEDDKTSSYLGSQLNKQFDLSGQFTGYIWGAREHGFDVRGALLRVFAFYKDNKINHQPLVTYRTDEDIARWYKDVCYKLEIAKVQYKQNYFPHDYGEVCSTYGGCPFFEACKMPSEAYLQNNYKQEVWLPHLRKAVPIEEFDEFGTKV